MAIRDLFQQGGEVGGAFHLQEIVGSVAFQADDFFRRVVEGDALSTPKRCDFVFVEPLLARHHEEIFVPEGYVSPNPPQIATPIGV